jgi:hypothetical protein
MFAICLIMAMAISTSLVYAPSTTGTSTGTATVGAATPTISNVMLNDSTDSVNENGAALSVLTEYHYNVTVGDTNNLYALLNITIVVFSSGDTTVGGTVHNQTLYTFEYANVSNSWSEQGPNGGGQDMVGGNCLKPTDRTQTSGTYRLAFQLEGVANYTASATWKINCTVYAGATGTPNANDQTITFSVNAYYAITVADATHGWTGLNPNDNNVTLTSPAAGYITTYCTSNHYHYKLQAQSESASLTSGGNTITIGHVLIHASTLASSTNLTTSYANIGGLTVLSPSDAINVAGTFKLWISVPIGQASGSYTYVLDIQIASDT